MNRDSNFDEKLDFILSKHIDQLTADEFGSICQSIARGDSPYESEILFQSFLKESIPQCEAWLSNNSFSLKDLPAVAFAYSYIINDVDSDKVDSLQQKLESVIFENAQNLKVSEAVNLIQATAQFASPELVELLDRIIGNGIYDVSAE